MAESFRKWTPTGLGEVREELRASAPLREEQFAPLGPDTPEGERAIKIHAAEEALRRESEAYERGRAEAGGGQAFREGYTQAEEDRRRRNEAARQQRAQQPPKQPRQPAPKVRKVKLKTTTVRRRTGGVRGGGLGGLGGGGRRKSGGGGMLRF